jgi:hypothetical protein
MLKFGQFISEQVVVEQPMLVEAAGQEADAKGKAFEIEVARHLHPKGDYPTHYRDEDGKRPAEIAQHLQGVLGKDKYKTISDHAKTAVGQYREHLSKTGVMPKTKHPDIIAWTSQPSDHKAFTGKHDPNANADVMYRHGRKFRGLSLKYGAAPGVRSPGMEDLSTLSHANHDKVKSMISSHRDEIHNIMGKHIDRTSTLGAQHKAFKEVVASGSSAAKGKAEQALEASRKFRAGLATHYATHFNKLSHADMSHAVRRLASAEDTMHPHDKIHFDDKKGQVHISDPVGDFNKMHAKVSHYSAEGKGGYLHIHAHTPDGNKHHILKISIKNKSSSPYTNIVGAASHGKDYSKLAS